MNTVSGAVTAALSGSPHGQVTGSPLGIGFAHKRYIRTFKGIDTYGVLNSPETFTGDYSVTTEFVCPSASATGALQAILGGTDPVSPSQIRVDTLGNFFVRWADGDVSAAFAPVGVTPFDGKVHACTLERIGTSGKFYIDGVLQNTTTVVTTAAIFGALGIVSTAAIAFYFAGESLSVKFTDNSGASPVVTNYVIDNDSATTTYARGEASPSTKYITWSNFAASDIQLASYNHQAARWEGEEQIVDGGIDTACGVNWTCGTGWSIAAGVASCDGTQIGDTKLTQAISFTAGARALVSYNQTAYTAGNSRGFLGNTLPMSNNTVAYFSEVLTAGAGSLQGVNADLDFIGSVDNVSVKQIWEY